MKSSSVNNLNDETMIVPATIVKGNFTLIQEESEFKGLTRSSTQIADVTMLYAQRIMAETINEKQIYEQAIRNVSPVIKKFNLDEKTTSREKRRKNDKIISAILSNEIRELVSNEIALKSQIVVDFNDFVSRLKIVSIHRKGNNQVKLHLLYKIIQEARNKAVLKCKVDNWIDVGDKLEKETKYIEYSLIPSFTITVKGEEGDKEFETFEELAKSKKNNKMDFIKDIRFTFNPEALSMLALPRIEDGYSITNRKNRIGFSQYAFQLDWIVRSIRNAQYNKNLNKWSVEELKKTFGVKYSKYADFKRRVILPAIKEINNQGSIYVVLNEIKDGRKVTHLSFQIKSNYGGDRNQNGIIFVFSLQHFIAVQHFYSSEYVTDDIEKYYSSFDEYIKYIADFTTSFYTNRDKKLSASLYDLTLEEWKDIYNAEISVWQKMCELVGRHEKIFADRNYVLDDERIGLVDKYSKEYISTKEGGKEEKSILPSIQVKYIQKIINSTDRNEK